MYRISRMAIAWTCSKWQIRWSGGGVGAENLRSISLMWFETGEAAHEAIIASLLQRCVQREAGVLEVRCDSG